MNFTLPCILAIVPGLISLTIANAAAIDFDQ